ncbi:MAG TPA: UdgX family uracil-DNA binding protein [Candidatus Limnocylindrales bacterium]|jgi:DNA polymerase
MAIEIPPERRPEAARDAVTAGRISVDEVRELARGCRACPLWRRATQTVFGEGPTPARVLLVGEQPGDHEDLDGAPFVGPAGRILDRAMAEAGIDRETAFVTNIVKHFKWKPAPSGKRRLHERPNRAEVGACLPWVQAELDLVEPEAVVLLGATAAQGLVGPRLSVMRDRGRALESDLAPLVVATIHPSAVLRGGDEHRDALFDGLVADLRVVAEALEDGRGPQRRRRPVSRRADGTIGGPDAQSAHANAARLHAGAARTPTRCRPRRRSTTRASSRIPVHEGDQPFATRAEPRGGIRGIDGRRMSNDRPKR